MAATQTVAQPFLLRKPVSDRDSVAHNSSAVGTLRLKPNHGVITLSGYGIRASVDRGHLILEDGVGPDRRNCRLPRVDHGLKRLVIIGSDGTVSLAALRWLADQKASLVLLERDGSVLATTGPVRSSDVRLRRAQALALQNGIALRISRDLIDRKLAGQERVAIQWLENASAALAIRAFRSDLAGAQSINAVRLIESQAASAYWSAWRNLPIMYPKSDLRRVPEHWRRFDSRTSSLTCSPRHATNPANAILNYLYAVLEAESRLAAATLGLDPGIGVLHVDTPYRDSLACDLMEPVRPDVDAFVLQWLRRDPLRRSDFFEQNDGNCRLMASFASSLSQIAPKWAHLVAPVAEWFAREIGSSRRASEPQIPARLTQRNKRVVKGGDPLPSPGRAFSPQRTCHGCGKEISYRATLCKPCAKEITNAVLAKATPKGRIAAQSPEAQHKRSTTRRANAIAQSTWNSSDQPAWLTQDFYSTEILPRLPSVSGALIAERLRVSYSYAGDIRKGRQPHPRHWRTLTEIVGLGQLKSQ